MERIGSTVLLDTKLSIEANDKGGICPAAVSPIYDWTRGSSSAEIHYKALLINLEFRMYDGLPILKMYVIVVL